MSVMLMSYPQKIKTYQFVQNFRMSGAIASAIAHVVMRSAARVGKAAIRKKPPQISKYLEEMKPGSEELMKKQGLVTDGTTGIWFDNGEMQKGRIWTVPKDHTKPVKKFRIEKPYEKVVLYNSETMTPMDLVARCFIRGGTKP